MGQRFRSLSLGITGHSQWSKVKHIKGPLDAQRGAVSSQLVKEITVAARWGGGDLPDHPHLRSVVEIARAAPMPKDPDLTDKTVLVMVDQTAAQVLHRYEASDDHDDTRTGCPNFDLAEAFLGRLAA